MLNSDTHICGQMLWTYLVTLRALMRPGFRMGGFMHFQQPLYKERLVALAALIHFRLAIAVCQGVR